MYISLISIYTSICIRWTLTPGVVSGNAGLFGAGGGGVLVDGAGPEAEVAKDPSRGYGAGGGGWVFQDNEKGYPGFILLEVD